MKKSTPSFSLNSFIVPNYGQNEEWYKNATYQDAKEIIWDKFRDIGKDFVVIGYYLKHIRDKEQYKEDGYLNIWECAMKEFGLSQAAASRYINMCSRYSINGDSPVLDDRYIEFSKSQLQEMLSIKDEKKLEQITSDMSVKQIREKIKKEKVVEEEVKDDDEQSIREPIIETQENIIDVPYVVLENAEDAGEEEKEIPDSTQAADEKFNTAFAEVISEILDYTNSDYKISDLDISHFKDKFLRMLK